MQMFTTVLFLTKTGNNANAHPTANGWTTRDTATRGDNSEMLCRVKEAGHRDWVSYDSIYAPSPEKKSMETESELWSPGAGHGDWDNGWTTLQIY